MKPNIATANGLTRGQVSAVLIKIAEQLDVDDIQVAVEIFLRGTVEITTIEIIHWLDTTTTSATTERFVAKDKFKLKNKGGICSSISSNFKTWYLFPNYKIEEPQAEQKLRFGTLLQTVTDRPIINELGEVKAETTLTDLFDLMSKQSNREEGNLVTDGHWNIFCIRDINDVLRTVGVCWVRDGWYADAYVLRSAYKWDANSRVFYRKP